MGPHLSAKVPPGVFLPCRRDQAALFVAAATQVKGLLHGSRTAVVRSGSIPITIPTLAARVALGATQPSFFLSARDVPIGAIEILFFGSDGEDRIRIGLPLITTECHG